MQAIVRPHGGRHYKRRPKERKKTHTYQQLQEWRGMDLKFPNNHFSIMRRTHPKAWNVVMRRKGLGKVLWRLRWAMDQHQLDMFEQTMDLDEYLDTFPCAFDRI